MPEHPIQGLMRTAMEHIRDMVSANTIVGAPVVAQNGTTVLPICRVSFGFAAGGGEFSPGDGQANSQANNAENIPASQPQSYPFGGGSGAGVSITPIAFLVVGTEGVNVLPLGQQAHVVSRLLDAAPAAFDRLQALFRKNAANDVRRDDQADNGELTEQTKRGHASRSPTPDPDRLMRQV